jgi:hypothetical protein
VTARRFEIDVLYRHLRRRTPDLSIGNGRFPGSRGLPGGSSLAKVLADHGINAATGGRPATELSAPIISRRSRKRSKRQIRAQLCWTERIRYADDRRLDRVLSSSSNRVRTRAAGLATGLIS